MEIRTKFNRNDIVYPITCLKDKYEIVWGECRIYKIVIEVDTKVYIGYELDIGNGLIIGEKECFATKEEAQKECDKRNGTI